MSRFMENSVSETLRLDLGHAERCVHHSLDNFAMDMDNELREALQSLEVELKRVSKMLENSNK